MELALACLVAVVLLAAIAIKVLAGVVRAQRDEIQALNREHAAERALLLEQATDERRELLTQIRHPGVIVTKQPERIEAPPQREPDQYDLVGVVQPDVEPEPGDEEVPR